MACSDPCVLVPDHQHEERWSGLDGDVLDIDQLLSEIALVSARDRNAAA